MRSVEPQLEAQKQHFESLRSKLSGDRTLFRQVYRYVFVVGKERDQRALAKETAVTFWEMLFRPPGLEWVSPASGTDFLEEWKAFLAERWPRSVNRDMWNMTLEFAFRSLEDETLSFWSEDGAWPGVIDEFVAWYRARTAMDVDA